MKERSGMPYDVVAFENDEYAFALSVEEEGIFHRMLRKAWMNGTVPADLNELAYLCRINPRTMRKAWPKLEKLWTPVEGNSSRIFSKKLESERKFLEYKRNLAQCAGKASAKARQIKETASTDVQHTSSTSLPSPSLPNKRDTEEEKPPIVPRLKKPPSDTGFLEFWDHYPKKVGKAAAERAWLKLLPMNGDLEHILAALQWQVKSDRWTRQQGQFIPDPASYLNGRRWNDRPMVQPSVESDEERSKRRLAEIEATGRVKGLLL